MEATNRPIFYNICNWGLDTVWFWGDTVAHSWRTGYDICTPGNVDWNKIMYEVDLNAALYSYAGPGHWNDPDMLTCGMNGLNLAQNRSHFALWCIMASPLILGSDLRSMSDSVRAIVTNKEVIAIDQDSLGIQGKRVKNTGGLEIWSKKMRDTSLAVVLFNRNTTTKDITVTLADLGLPAGTYYVRDLWKHQDMGVFPAAGYVAKQLVSCDAAVLRISRNLPVGIYSGAPVQKNRIGDRLFAVSNDAAGFKIGLLSEGKHQIEIFSINGSRIDSRSTTGPGNIVLSIPVKGSGLFLIRVSSGTRTQSEKIIIK